MRNFCLIKIIFIVFIFLRRGFCAFNEQTNGANIDCEKEKMLDKAGFEAITTLHKSMDDDLSGTIDLSESIEFVREELRITEKDRMDKRQKAFHQNNDEFITVDDLWCRWVHSEERRWTTDQLINWLDFGVELPQYKSIFLLHNVRGLILPRLAVQNTSFLSSVLGIVNPVHRQKVQLKALDVVLFGFRQVKPTYWKDVLLVSLLCCAVGGYWFAVSQRTAAQREMGRLSNQMDKLKDIETEFQDLQDKFHEEKRKKESIEKKADTQEMEKAEQVETLKNQLLHAERLWEKRHPMLQHLLRRTYELEMNRINQQKLSSLREMAEAREMVEKFRRKQSSLFNQIRTVHGADMEVIDDRILGLKTKLEETARAMEECGQRWSQIETLSGFTLIHSPSSSHVHTSSSLPGFAHSHVLHNDDLDELESENDFASHSGSEGPVDVAHLNSIGTIQVSSSFANGFERPSSLYDNGHNSVRSATATLNDSKRLKSPVVFELVNSSLNNAQRSVSAVDLCAVNGRLPSSPSVNDVRHQQKPSLNRSDTRDSFHGSELAPSIVVNEPLSMSSKSSSKASSKKSLKTLFKIRKHSAAKI